MNIGINGIGCITACGNSTKDFFNQFHGKTKNDEKNVERAKLLGITNNQAALISEFDPKKYISKKNNRKFPMHSKLAVASSKIALDSGNNNWSESELNNMGLTFCNEGQIEILENYLKDFYERGWEQSSPKLFSQSAVNTVACHVGMEHGLHGPSISLNSKFTGGFSSLYTGISLIKTERANSVLVGSVDYLSKTILDIYRKMKALKCSKDDPFGANLLGEGAISLILSNEHSDMGKILNIKFLTSDCSSNKWPKESFSHMKVLKETIKDEKIDFYFTSNNGDQNIKNIEDDVFNNLIKSYAPSVINIKEKLGEFSGIPLMQIMLACLKPKNSKSLISVIGPGGIHGGILVESSGRLQYGS